MNIHHHWKKYSIAIIIVTLLLVLIYYDKNDNLFHAQNLYSLDPEVISHGQQIFNEKCSSCHNFTNKSIGPSLQYTTNRLSKEWLSDFIKNASEMVASGDTRAIMLFDQYKQVMPSFNELSDDEIDAVLAYMHQNQKSEEKVQDSEDIFITNPIPEPIPKTGGKLYLRSHSIAPATREKAPMARINKMEVLRGEKERMFVIDLEGILYEITDRKWNVVMDIRKRRSDFVSSPGLGTGFGSFAFHPEFDKNRLFYTTHSEKYKGKSGDLGFADSVKIGLQWVLTEWKVNDPFKLPFQVKGREMLRIDLFTTSHGVQEISFNPYAVIDEHEDYGLLYICIGDGGAGEKGYDNLCNSNLHPASCILRIDPLGNNSENKMYGIPANNPFVEDDNPFVLKEIYCTGFRNPNRISWSPDGKMLITDIGQANIEELNIGLPGANYGWPYREGTFLFDPQGDINKVYELPHSDYLYKYIYPVLQYDHDEGNAISGGFVYNGNKITALKDKYVFGDIVNGRFFISENKHLQLGELAPIKELDLVIDNEATDFQKLNGANKPDPRIGIGIGGEIFVFTKADGKLYEVIDYKPYQ